MKSKVEKTKNANEIKLEITIEAEKFDEAIKKVYFKSAKYISIPGFRKGKAPIQIVEKYYGKEYFIRLLDQGVCPQTKWVEGSNFVDIGFKLDPRTNRIIMMGALDNLVKGAAGQAVQNMNLMFGLDEAEGLRLVPMFP